MKITRFRAQFSGKAEGLLKQQASNSKKAQIKDKNKQLQFYTLKLKKQIKSKINELVMKKDLSNVNHYSSEMI